MKIVELKAENIKKLVAVEIRPDGNVVQITGRNGQGKTSVLDSIWWALGGGAAVQAEPIREGERFAKITLDLGDIMVTRTFKKDKEGGTSSSLFVEGRDGTKFSSPQAVLDGVLGKLTFDPLEFARMKPRDQFDVAKTFVSGFDFEACEAEKQACFQKRAILSRQSKEKKAAASQVVVPAGPKPFTDETPILNEISFADTHNMQMSSRKSNRETAYQTIARNREEAKKLLNEANELEAQISESGPLPELKDVTEIMRRLAVARDGNAAWRAEASRTTLEDEAENLEGEARAMTDRMAALEEGKRAAIAAATLPIDGLSFGDGSVTLRGVPFDQASDAERLRASVAIAMALNPKLRVVRIRDGSLLDSTSMGLVAEMAEQRDCQVWIEKVDETSSIGFVVEDGRLAEKKPAAV